MHLVPLRCLPISVTDWPVIGFSVDFVLVFRLDHPRGSYTTVYSGYFSYAGLFVGSTIYIRQLDFHYVDTKVVLRRVQELSADDGRESGRIPRTVECELTSDLVDSCVPGDMVTVTGIVKATSAEDGNKGGVVSVVIPPSCFLPPPPPPFPFIPHPFPFLSSISPSSLPPCPPFLPSSPPLCLPTLSHLSCLPLPPSPPLPLLSTPLQLVEDAMPRTSASSYSTCKQSLSATAKEQGVLLIPRHTAFTWSSPRRCVS